MPFSVKRWAYSDVPSFSSQSAIACIEALPPAPFYRAELLEQRNGEFNRQIISVVHRRWTKPPKQTVLSLALKLRADVSVNRVD